MFLLFFRISAVSAMRLRLNEFMRSIFSIPRSSILFISYWLIISPVSDIVSGIFLKRSSFDTINAEGCIDTCLI